MASYAHVVLSPHFDDAALSCGGRIHHLTGRGQRVLVVTLFAGDHGPRLSPFAQSLHEQWGHPADVIAARRAEDDAALRILGADTARLDFPDCIYRGAAGGRQGYYTDEAALFGPVHPAESHLPDQLAAAIAALLPGETAVTVYAPLSVGNHVDHQMAHAAALRLKRPNLTVVFYEDYPYADWPNALQAAREARGAQSWTARTMPFDRVDLAAKIEAVRTYQSQLGVLFGNEAAMVERVTAYARRLGGGQPAERTWQPAA
ncbi:MAG: PIG-L deacetylase family protein [Anaerolineae bacterium]